MSTDTNSTQPLKKLSDVEKFWLGKVVGGKDFYGDVTGIKSMDAKGNPIDLVTLESEVRKAVEESEKSGKPVSQEVVEKKNVLAQYGISVEADFDKQSEARDKALEEVRNVIEMEKEAIRKSSQEATSEKKGSTFLKPTKPGPTQAQLNAINAVIKQITSLTEKLQSNQDVDISPEELMNEIWTPLVREGLITEKQCPAEFSRVVQLFRGANALYMKRLEEKTRKEREEDDQLGDVRDAIDDISDVLGIGAGVVDLVLGLVGGHGNVQKIVKLATKCAKGGLKASSALMQKQADFETAGSEVANILGLVLETAIGKPNGATIGKVAKGAFSGCVSLGLFAKKLCNQEYQSGLDLLADAVSTALGCVADGIAGSNKEASNALNDAAKFVGPNLKTAFAGGNLVFLLSQDPVDTKKVNAELQKIARIQLKLAIATTVDKGIQSPEVDKKNEEINKLKEEIANTPKDAPKEELDNLYKKKKELEAELDQLETTHSKELDVISGLLGTAFAGQDSISGDLESKVSELAIKKGSDSANELIQLENAKFNKQLGIAFGLGLGGVEGDSVLLEELYSIDALILQIEQDNATLQMFKLILDAVGGIVTTLIPQLGGPLKAKELAFSVSNAIGRSMDLLNFAALLSDAKKASSPQGPALLAQIDELERQITSDLVNASIAFGQALSLSVAAAGDLGIGAMGVGGVASTTGRAINSALELVGQAKALYEKWAADRKTKRAWQNYQNARNNPSDRDEIIKAFRSNPTLAKYSVAYGALEMDDPIARECLRQLGINDVVLAQEKTSADKVVMFLEARFSDDLTVEGSLASFVPDKGAPLTIATWVKNKEFAKTATPEKWLEVKTTAIDSALVDFQAASKEFAKNDISLANRVEEWNASVTAKNNFTAAADKLKNSLQGFTPTNESGQPFKAFQEYIAELISLVDSEIEAANKKVSTAKQALQYQKKHLSDTVDNINNVSGLVDISKNKVVEVQKLPTQISTIAILGKGGQVGDLPSSLMNACQSTPLLVQHIELFAHAIKSTERSAIRETNAQRLGDLLTNLLKSFDTFSSSLSQELDRAKRSMTAYEKIDLK